MPHLYPSVDEPLGCSHVLPIVNNAAMNIGVHAFFELVFFFFFLINPGVELFIAILGPMVTLFLVF